MPELKIKASLDRSAYDKGLEEMKNASKSLDKSLQGLGRVGGMIAGVFGGNVLSALVQSTFGRIMDGLKKTQEETIKLSRDAENIGVSFESFREAQDVFQHFGESGETLVGMFGRLEDARDEALGGNEKLIASFKELGLSVDQIAKMDLQSMFDVISKAYSGATGATRTAAVDIFGRAARTPGVRRSLTEYGQGKRYRDALEIDEREAVGAELMSRKMSKAGREIGNFFFTGFQNGMIGSVRKWFTDVSDKDVDREIQKRKLERDITSKENAEAMQASKDRDALQQAEREREIRDGLHIQAPRGDSYARRGLLAAGAGFNSAAYTQGRQQVQLAQQLLESSRRIEAQLAKRTKTPEAVK